MNRFLSRRDKGTPSHTRQKSREKSSDRKVLGIFAPFSNPNPPCSCKGELVNAVIASCVVHGILYTVARDCSLPTYSSYKKVPPAGVRSKSEVTLLAKSRNLATIANSPSWTSQTRPLSGESLAKIFGRSDPQKKLDKEQSNKYTIIRQRLAELGYSNIEDGQIDYALASKYANGDLEKGYEMVLLFQESVEGIVKPYDPNVVMLGAENREAVTCYLDSLLFAMFSRLNSFEPMLYASFEDEPRRRLSTLIRLWVNLLRTGKLIQTDLTQHLQEALAACGWEDAERLEQQDTSEAFHFITEKLELPLLTLKMDIYHTGKEDDQDDHKYVEERLLEVAVPDESGRDRPVRLEDCLESYFNNQVEVVRHLERSNTRSSIRSTHSQHPDKNQESTETSHVEVSELSWTTPDTPSSPQPPETPILPTSRHRRASLIRHRMVYDDEKEDTTDQTRAPTPIRKGSVRKEVLMPAWQFFNLIPWYTNKSAGSDADVASHFSKSRPVLGICLKRYAMTADGRAVRKNTFIDIPLDIKLPHFIQDEVLSEDGPLMGNFKLSLQSVICHRGDSVHSGHYISFMRGTTQISDGDAGSSRRLSSSAHPPLYSEDQWVRLDDMANPRVQTVDIEEEMKHEMPYLLFYQVQPTYEMSRPTLPDANPPSYHETGIGFSISTPQSTKQIPQGQSEGYFDGVDSSFPPTARHSTEIERPDEQRRSINLSEARRGSLAFTEQSTASNFSTSIPSAPATPAEETAAQRMTRAAARFTKSTTKSRPPSQNGDGRLSMTITNSLSKLNWRASKEQLSSKTEVAKDKETVEILEAHQVLQMDGAGDSHEPEATEEILVKTDDESTPAQRSKKSKKRDKSRGPFENIEPDGHHHHHYHRHKGKSKDKGSKEIDRECSMM